MDSSSAGYQIRSLFQKAHYWNFYKIMETEKNLGLRSTFFFLNETYPFNPLKIASWRLSLGYYDLFEPNLQTVIRELDSQGWEVGLHGSYLSYKDIGLLKKEKSDLEGIIGHSILGVRQHYLNLDQSTWERHVEAGFLYDASFGFTDNIGFKENRFHPFQPISDKHFYVVPLALMDAMGLSEYCQDINHLDADRLIEQFCEIENNTKKLRSMIRQRTEAYRKALDEQYNFIFNNV